MAKQFDVVIERDAEGTCVASVPAIPGCHTQARSLDDLMVRVREAIEVNLGAVGDDIEPSNLSASSVLPSPHDATATAPRVRDHRGVEDFKRCSASEAHSDRHKSEILMW